MIRLFMIMLGGLIVLLATGSCSIQTLPKAALNSSGAAGGAVIGSLVGQPVAGAAVGSAVATAITEEALPETPQVDDFWSLMGKLVEVGGWVVGLILLVPLLLGWMIPNREDRRRQREWTNWIKQRDSDESLF